MNNALQGFQIVLLISFNDTGIEETVFTTLC